MSPFRRMFALTLLSGLSTTVAPAVRAETGTQVGVRSGIQLLENERLRQQLAPLVGAEARVGFELSPLVLALSFDIEERTLFQVGANALYDLRHRRLRSSRAKLRRLPQPTPE